MQASKLVIKLNELIEQYGDLKIRFDGPWGDSDIDTIIIYDEDGNKPDEFHIPNVIHLHGKATP